MSSFINYPNYNMKSTAKKPRRFYNPPFLKKYGSVSGLTRGDNATNY